MSQASKAVPILQPGDKIKEFTITKRIGFGGYAQIYEVTNSNHEVFALKLERFRPNHSGLNHEIKVLSFLPKLGCFTQAVHAGFLENNLQYLVMKKYQPSIYDVYKAHGKRFDETAAFHVGLKMLSIIEKLHSLGVMHWDIKPSNFLMNMSEEDPIVLIDFGCASKIRPNGLKWNAVIGTQRYASVNDHKLNRIGLPDELICWFYSVLELVSPKPLPWSLYKSGESILKCKESNKFKKYMKKYPNFVKIYDYLNILQPNEKPSYEYLELLMREEMKRRNIPDEFNWLEFVNKETLFVYNATKKHASSAKVNANQSKTKAKCENANANVLSAENNNHSVLLS